MHYTAKLLPPTFFEKFKIFSENPSFFQNSSNCLISFKNLTNRVAFCSKLATISNFWNFEGFFQKTHFFCKKTQLLKVLRNLTVPFAFEIQLANFNCFQKIHVFFRKIHLFFWIAQSFNVLGNLTVSVAFYIKLAIISSFWKFQGFFRKTHLFFAKPKFWMFWENCQFQLHSVANFLPSAVVERSTSLRKQHLFLKIPNFERFEKFYFFIRFLQQKCHL